MTSPDLMVTVEPPPPAPVPPQLDTLQALAALAHPLRWRMFNLLLTKGPLAPVDLAGELKTEFDNTAKHLRVMHRAGVVAILDAGDKRCRFYYVPKKWRTAAGDVDLGFCLLRFAANKPASD